MRDDSWGALTGFVAFAGFGLIAIGCGSGSSGSSSSSSAKGTVLASPSANPSQPASPVTSTGGSQTKTNPNPPNFPTPSPTTSPGASPSPGAAAGHIYIINNTSNDLSAFAYDATGALSGGVSTAFPAAVSTPVWLTLDKTNSVVFAAFNGGAMGMVVPVQVNAGAVTMGAAIATAGAGPFGIAADPTGLFVYACDFNAGAAGDVSGFSYVTPSGALTATKSVTGTALGTGTVVVNPAGGFLYTGNSDSTISAYALTSGVPSVPAGFTPVATSGTGPPFVITIDPAGAFIFSGNGDGSISIVTLTAKLPVTTPAVVQIGTATTGSTGIFGIAVNPTGTALLTANELDDSVSGFTVAGGVVSKMTASPFVVAGTGPSDVAIDPTGAFAFVTNSTTNTVQAYTLGTTLTAVGSAAALPGTSSNPFALVVGP